MAMKVKALLFCVFILIPLLSTNCGADDDISNPGNIPFFDNFRTPQLRPGESGGFGFSIENRYLEDMTNVTLTAGVYAVASPYFYEEIKEVKSPPKINDQGIESEFFLQTIENGTMVWVNFTISSFSDTTQGTYFVRFQLNFNYDNTPYIMQSRGYFTDSEWDSATSNVTDDAPGEVDDDPGEVNITILGVDGIIPDSSFKVLEPIPIWPLYVCIIPLAVMLSILAILFYVQEQYNMFPWLDQGFKYWTGKFHQSWRLFKHRFR
jgi:hypothetical protein